ncbi:hypothetical protein J3R30DRAFT_3583500 [Lentinula aciculospora]|uniref:G-protein coupled receptors family 2 profile 2 domain-containing protein n=1 Tax=Lentinula aciculospora TaxID=153920 RepID=A0A9W8ZUE3_9AGAR|nr:hypothetical protein J3R30DRAFT_3583500 [Lentinula aciculospora]
MSSFVFTNEMALASNHLWMFTSIIGASMCFVVLILICSIALHPVSRPHLDRVSFRILAFALAVNTVFGIVNAIGGSFTGPTWTCGFTIWILQLTLQLSSFLMFSIALNMQLVIVHGINGQRMEKFYMLGSVTISLAVTIPAYATKQYGWDPLVQDCWYANSNQTERFAWQIGTQLFWTLLTVLGETTSSLVVVIYMFNNRTVGGLSTSSSSHLQQGSSSTQSNKFLSHASRYKKVLFRIALYPFTSMIMNLLSVMCVIHATITGGEHNMNDYRILLLSDFLYGGRAVVYALLTTADPAFLSAWKALLDHKRQSSTWSYNSPHHIGTGRTRSQSQTHQSKGVIQVTLQNNDDIGLELDTFEPDVKGNIRKASLNDEVLPTFQQSAQIQAEAGDLLPTRAINISRTPRTSSVRLSPSHNAEAEGQDDFQVLTLFQKQI